MVSDVMERERDGETSRFVSPPRRVSPSPPHAGYGMNHDKKQSSKGGTR